MTRENRTMHHEDRLLYALAGVTATLIFFLFSSIHIPNSISRAVSVYSFVQFVVVLLFYYLCFKVPEKYRWSASASLTLFLLGMSLSFLWSSGYSDDKIVGGLLPFRDGFDYFNGAQWLLNGHSIRTINEGAAWRPLYPGFLASLLWMTGRNLQWSLGIQVAAAGLCFTLAGWQIRNRLGAVAAAVFMTLLYYYIQPLTGTAYTETLGLAFGCLGFVLLWTAALSRSTGELIVGLCALMMAVSTRAGAFFIFPALILWAGWAWRGQRRYSLRQAAIALTTVVVCYAAVNVVFNKLMVEPGGSPFGNFAFTIYGQVTGGTGYHKAFEDLGARNPAIILHAAERFFIAHPLGFVAGSAKAYRDFFSPSWGAFSYGFKPQDLGLASLSTLLLFIGVYRLGSRIHSSESSLLLAGFVGILLSIPFLPPIDGGMRIYAASMPFIWVLPARAVTALHREANAETSAGFTSVAGIMALALGFFTVAVPVLIRFMTAEPVFRAPNCPEGQTAFTAEVSPGSFIDLVSGEGATCGRIPEVCLAPFQSYVEASDPSDAAVLDQLATASEGQAARVFAANDIVNGKPHLFVGNAIDLTVSEAGLISGCASESQIKGRPSIYSILSITEAKPHQ